jgi:hypothetical protein
MATVSCGVRCARNQPPAPSTVHAAAEARFADHVMKVGEHFRCASDFCKWICGLDACVRSGSVRRQSAAFHASSFLHRRRGIRDALLIDVLTHMTTRCPCLRTVLNWGVCPTAIGDCFPRRQVSYESSLGYARTWVPSDLAKWAEQELLMYGAAPCLSFRVAQLGNELRVVVPKPTEISSNARKRWWRWHARQCRVRWIICGSGVQMATEWKKE